MNPYIEDVSRRLAVAGFIAFSPDALAPLGGYLGNDYAAYTYTDVNHGFHNDTTPRYSETAAGLAWQRTNQHVTEQL